MLKLTILLALATLGFAQDDGETLQNKENEQVTALDLSNQGITSLNEYNFSKYPLLEELDLSNNDIQYIDEDVFNRNPNLKKLNLSGNKNLQLPEFSTLLIAEIEELDLSNCNIELLPSNIFDGLLNLKTVDLSENPLEDNAVQVSTLLAVLSPQKLILPHIDEAMINEICEELDITIGIKSQGYLDSIKCSSVREGKWDDMVKESPSQTLAHDEETHLDEGIFPDVDNQLDNDINVEIKRQAIPDEANQQVDNQNDDPSDKAVASEAEPSPVGDDNPQPEAPAPATNAEQENPDNVEPEPVAPENANPEGEPEAAAPVNETPEGEPANTDNAEPAPELENTDNVEPAPAPENVEPAPAPENAEPAAESENTDNAEPAPEPENTDNVEPEPSAPEGEDNTASPPENTDAINPPGVKPEDTENGGVSEPNGVDPVTTKEGDSNATPDPAQLQNVPDAIDGQHGVDAVDGKQAGDVVDGQAAPEGNQEPKPSNGEQQINEDVPVARQRGISVPENPETNKPRSAIPTNNADEDQTKAGESSTPSSTGSTVLVILVIAVIVAGAAAFGYKFYKTRTYQAAHSTEPVGRELKEIVVDKKSNGSSNPRSPLEEEPLMERRENSVEVKEIDEASEQTTNAASSSNNSGPATAPAKPPHVNQNDDKTQI